MGRGRGQGLCPYCLPAVAATGKCSEWPIFSRSVRITGSIFATVEPLDILLNLFIELLSLSSSSPLSVTGILINIVSTQRNPRLTSSVTEVGSHGFPPYGTIQDD